MRIKFAAPCGRLFERSCGHFGSQQASYRRNRRGSAICKKRFQKCGVSSFFLINSSSYLLSDSYNGTLFKSLHSVYIKWYWLISFGFVDQKVNEIRFSYLYSFLCFYEYSIHFRLLQFKNLISTLNTDLIKLIQKIINN